VGAYRKAIKEIVRFKKAFDKIESTPKLSRKLVGDIGEFYVLCELEQRGYKEIQHKGGQAGYDIYIKDIDKKIEVRTSLSKNEGLYPDGIEFFGWRVENRNAKKKKKFDIMVGVALDGDFIKPKFYVFTHKEAFSVEDVNIGRFKNIKKKIHVFTRKNIYKKAVEQKPELVTKYERYINENQSKFLNKWKKIKK
jgi:hypothetical protein